MIDELVLEQLLDGVRDAGSVGALQQVERQVQARRDAAGADEVAVVDHPGADWARAVHLLSACETLRAGCNPFLAPCERAVRDEALAEARDGLDATAFDAAWQEGAAVNAETAITRILDVIGERSVEHIM